MGRKPGLGMFQLSDILESNGFYVDKTHFIKEWLENNDTITLITRPRRFGKTLMLNTVETFFSNRFAESRKLFENLSIWKEEKYRQMQGKYPVISLSLANVKQNTYDKMKDSMKRRCVDLYLSHIYLKDSDKLEPSEKETFVRLMGEKGSHEEYMESILRLSGYLYKHFGQKVYILVDEYDTPMLEAYVEGYWDEAMEYVRRMFHATFKDNPFLERGLMTGITRITQESIFSDLNNLTVVTTTTKMYEDCFGFTQGEVDAALEEFGLLEHREKVKKWYDGFGFGMVREIYNPWSVINFLKFAEYEPYWMNTSSNALVGKLIQEGIVDVKLEFEELLSGRSVVTEIDESITYAELQGNTKAVWSWLLTTGYLKIISRKDNQYELGLTNYEVRMAFCKLVKKWFDASYNDYTNFMKMLLRGDLEGMQYYMERVTKNTFSYFDVGNGTEENEKAEQFYHGFTIGLIADLYKSHILTSNRESGLGRYDICLEPMDKSKEGIIIEFKVFDAGKEKSLKDTAQRALEQIHSKGYEADLKARGIEQIRKYGFAFKGKEVIIVQG